MLTRIYSFVKLNFNKRFILAGAVFISLSLFGTFPSIIVRLVALAVFIASSCLFVPTFIQQYFYNLKILRVHSHRERFSIPLEYAQLAKDMGTKISDYAIVSGRNAYAFFGSLVIGAELIQNLSPEELYSVVAHELGHIKRNHALLRPLLMTPLMFLPFFAWTTLNSPIFYSETVTLLLLSIMMIIAFFAYVTFVTIPINWKLELSADKASAKFAGKTNIISALRAIAKMNKQDLSEPSETHPSIKERIDKIENLKL